MIKYIVHVISTNGTNEIEQEHEFESKQRADVFVESFNWTIQWIPEMMLKAQYFGTKGENE